jgi:RNA polymerase sigma factor (sigma-70 family)
MGQAAVILSPTITHTGSGATGATPSVADLLLRVGNGDQEAWDEIIHRYGKRVFATVRSFRLQEADVLDAVQMTWLRLAEHAHQIRYPEQLGGWLVTTARRECLSILRHAQRTPSFCEAALEEVADPLAGPEQCVINADIIRRLWNLVSELSPRRQALLRALFTDHLRSYAEVARSCDIPPGGIGPTRARALAQLRDKLEQDGFRPGRRPCTSSTLRPLSATIQEWVPACGS